MSAPIEIDRCCDCRRLFIEGERPGQCVIHPGGAHHMLPCREQTERFQAEAAA